MVVVGFIGVGVLVVCMCKANSDCDAVGRRAMSGRRCTECQYVLANCSNCGNDWSYDSREPHPHKCPECGRH